MKNNTEDLKYNLLQDQTNFLNSKRVSINNNKLYNILNENSILLLSSFGISLLVINLLTFNYIFTIQFNLGINIINFYRGVIYVLLSVCHFTIEKVNLEIENNFNKSYFYPLLIIVFLENTFILLILLAFKNLLFANFSFYLCYYVLVKMIINKINFMEEINRNDYILIGVGLIFLLIHFIEKNNENEYFKGVIFFFLAIVILEINKKIEENYINPIGTPNYFIFSLTNGLFGIILTPTFISFEDASNKLNFFYVILCIIISISIFYCEIIFNKIKNNLVNYKILVNANLFFVTFIIMGYLADNLTYLDFLIGFVLSCLFLIKFLNNYS